jgi:hypothetical protein
MKKQTIYLGIRLSLVISFVLISVVSPVYAATTTKKTTTTTSSSASSGSVNISQAVTQSYDASSAVQLGMIVQLMPKDPSTVEPLTESTISSMLGVVVAPNDATVTLTPQTSTKQQVFVATAGRYDVLVSDQNGPIRIGDPITISALAGIGMKADSTESIVLGKAAGSFSGGTSSLSTVNLKNSQGSSSKIAIGEIPIDLDIAHNPLASKDTDYVPSFLSKAASTVASKPVSAARIYLGILTLFVSAVVTGNLLYSGVKNGMQAIGRNPLSKKSIIRSLIQTVIAGLIIFIVGVFAVYLLLKL